jgi:predicted enzyme related to lactoylglutathione lyase
MLVVPPPTEPDRSGSILYFDSRNIEADFAALKALGVTIKREPFVAHSEDTHKFWLAFFNDSEGNTLGLTQWKRVIG